MSPDELVPIDEGVYCLEHNLRMPGGTLFPTRMTLIRLGNGDVWMHSAVPISDAIAAKIDAIGPVRHLVAPNLYHHLFVIPALERWPQAQLWIAPGLEKKRPDLAHGLRLDASTGMAAWGNEITVNPIAGAPKLNECVFFHRPSGSLIVSDLFFNFDRARGFRQALLFRIMDVSGGLRQSRVWGMITADRKAAAESCEPIFAWPIRRIIAGHGMIRENATTADVRAAITRF